MMADGIRVFEGFCDPDVVLWTSVITGYQRNGNAKQAMLFFSRMVVENAVVPDPVTVFSLAAAVGSWGIFAL